MNFMKYIPLLQDRYRDEELFRLARVEYKKDYEYAYNWMKSNPGKLLEIRGDI